MRRGVVDLKSAGLDPDPSSAQSVIWDDPEPQFPQVAAAGNGGDALPLGMINEAAFRKLPCKYVFLPVSLLRGIPLPSKLPLGLAIALT